VQGLCFFSILVGMESRQGVLQGDDVLMLYCASQCTFELGQNVQFHLA
jgi:hypothetical protein